MTLIANSNKSIKQQKRRKKTKTVTFRIDGDVMQELEHTGKQEYISLNSFVNHILRMYVNWDMHLENNADMIPMSKSVLSSLFKNMSTDEVVKLAKEIGVSAIHNVVLFMKGTVEPDSFISWFLSRMQKSSASINMSTGENGIVRLCVIKHDLGYNWSLYHKTIMESIFYEILHQPINVGMTESTIIIELGDNKKTSNEALGDRV
ncbi:MAG: hypothetical protein WA941_19890 [Nitrososphaeraceae archaeon]